MGWSLRCRRRKATRSEDSTAEYSEAGMEMSPKLMCPFQKGRHDAASLYNAAQSG